MEKGCQNFSVAPLLNVQSLLTHQTSQRYHHYKATDPSGGDWAAQEQAPAVIILALEWVANTKLKTSSFKYQASSIKPSLSFSTNMAKSFLAVTIQSLRNNLGHPPYCLDLSFLRPRISSKITIRTYTTSYHIFHCMFEKVSRCAYSCYLNGISCFTILYIDRFLVLTHIHMFATKKWWMCCTLVKVWAFVRDLLGSTQHDWYRFEWGNLKHQARLLKSMDLKIDSVLS